MSSTGLSAYTCTPRQVKKFVVRCMKSGRVPFVQSSPAMGKSSIMRSIAKDYSLSLIDHRLSTSAPEDLSGLPKFTEGHATFVPFDTFPTEDTPIPPGFQGWMLFLDEFNSAQRAVQAAAYKLVLDRMVGLKKLHPNVVIVCAGNLATDHAIVNQIGTAMQSRLIHLTMELNFDEFMEDVALPQKWDGRVIAYLNYKKGALHDFRPDHNDKTFCSPRTWEFVNDLIKGQEYRVIQNPDGSSYYEMDAEAPLYAGAITSGVAVDFINFTKVYTTLVRLRDVVNDPEGTKLPTDSATRYATITHLMEGVDEDNFKEVATYINRLTAEFRVLFYRGLMIQKPELKKHPAFRQSMVDLSRYLHDDAPVARAA